MIRRTKIENENIKANHKEIQQILKIYDMWKQTNYYKIFFYVFVDETKYSIDELQEKVFASTETIKREIKEIEKVIKIIISIKRGKIKVKK